MSKYTEEDQYEKYLMKLDNLDEISHIVSDLDELLLTDVIDKQKLQKIKQKIKYIILKLIDLH